MIRHCMELPYGSYRHFPAGTYNEQVATFGGRLEMDAMETVQQAWRAFSYLSATEWGESERKLVAWLDKKPKQEPQPPRRVNAEIAIMWGRDV